MAWTAPSYVTSGEASSVQFNAETVDNLLYLKAAADAAPRGLIDRVFDDSSSQALTNTFATLGSCSIGFTAVVGRVYEAFLMVNFDNLGSGELIEVRIRYGSTTICGQYVPPSTPGGNAAAFIGAPFEPGAGAITVVAQALAGTPAGGENWTCDANQPTSFWVRDAGAA